MSSYYFIVYIYRPHGDSNFVNTADYVPPELRINPPKMASTVGGGGIASGQLKVATVRSVPSQGAVVGVKPKPGRRGRPPKHDVRILIVFLLSQ